MSIASPPRGACRNFPPMDAPWLPAKIRGLTSRRLKVFRAVLKHIQDGRCFYCGTPMVDPGPHGGPQPTDSATIDHRIPRSKGGRHFLDNLVVACQGCNVKRGNGDPPPAVDHAKRAEKKRLRRKMARARRSAAKKGVLV